MVGLAGLLSMVGCGGRVVVDELVVPAQGDDPEEPVPDGTGEPVEDEEPGASVPDGQVLTLAIGTDSLYWVDVAGQALTSTVDLPGCGAALMDIALTPEGYAYGTGPEGLYEVGPASGSCKLISGGLYPNSLALMPRGVVLPEDEALVGYREGSYLNMDLVTGAVTVLGELGGGYISSGDLVWAEEDGRAYAIVKGNGCNDCLAEIEPATGALLQVVGPLDVSNVYGLAHAYGVTYGFSYGGLVLRIDRETGITTPLPLVNAPPGISFVGATAPSAPPAAGDP